MCSKNVEKRSLSVHELGRLFLRSDAENCLISAGISLPRDIDLEKMSVGMSDAFRVSLLASVILDQRPTALSRKASYEKAYKNGVAFLQSLGYQDRHSDISSLNDRDLARKSSVLLDLIKDTPDDGRASKEILILIRNISSLIQRIDNGARNLSQARKRRGPSASNFKTSIIRSLFSVFHENLGYWPLVKESRDQERDGPATRWMQEVILLAIEKIKDHKINNKDILIAELNKLNTLRDNSIGTYIERAIAWCKEHPREPTS